ncbi:DUF1648 domain-containing protein [Rothia nasimurium]|uniref:DUF1648 domain-containing protein n=1 Tax=Rothia nasimurium TaxID=85336 RepID=UPI001F23B0FC|nr:DUF1648 domain-containing protein [Rothia nasimurium]
MTSAYPPIKPNRTWFLVALGLVVAELIYLALIYQSLPQQIPVHYNLWGRADGWAEKSIWSVFGLTLTLPALLALVWWGGTAMGRMASKDASAQSHDAFSPHAGKQGQRQLAAAQALGLDARVYSARRLYAQTQAVVPFFAGLALALALAVKIINLTVVGVLGEASVLFAPVLVVGYCLFLTARSYLAGKNFDSRALAKGTK